MWLSATRNCAPAPSPQWKAGQRRHQTRSSRSARPVLEALEDRCLLSFDPAVYYAVGRDPITVALGDFNGDGRPDLVTGNEGFNRSNVSVMLNNGDGTLQARVDYDLGGYWGIPIATVVGDLNADGTLDLATTLVGRVAILLGNGDGTFTTGASQDIGGGRPWSAALGDLDNDGDLDLAVANLDINVVRVLLGNGDGTFGAYREFPTGNFSADVDMADLNGDGNLDLATSNYDSDNVSVLLGNGDGTFQPSQNLPTVEGPISLAVGDLNRDGTLDLAVASFTVSTNCDYGYCDSTTQGYVNVLLGNGDGTFTAGNSYYAAVASDSEVADIDGDGKLDVVITSDNINSLLRGNADGTLNAPEVFPGGATTDMAAADLNGDGFLDIATANAGTNTVSVLLNDTNWPPPGSPSLSVSDVTVTEGNAGRVNAVFTVSLSAASDRTVTVTYSTADGTAIAGTDYTATPGTLTFDPGVTTMTIEVPVLGDRLAEPDESFFVNLDSATNAFLANTRGAGTIRDDEPHISISDVTRLEGKNRQTTLFVFTVTLSTPYDQPVTMSFATANGTATTGNSDYVARSGTLTFAPGETTKTITIEVKGDNRKEASETFFLDLSGISSNGLFTKSRGIGTILNDD